MVTFVSLFLGLVLGVSDVTVAVGADVARVELRLDGGPAGVLTAPSWKGSVDFGEELIPSELVAIAYDARGRELSRARQPINRPRPDAEATFVLEPVAVAELPFGGLYKDEALTELSSVVISLGTRKKLPEAAGLGGWFQGEGQSLRPVAVEEGPAEVVFVLDQSAVEPLREMAPKGMRMVSAARLGNDQRFRFLWAIPIRREHSGFQHDLFPRTEDLTGKDASFFLAARRVLAAPRGGLPQRLADAVAVAGLSAVRRERRRAVVLLLGPDPVDESRKSVEVVTRYLSRISVPFEVWCVHPGATAKAERWGGCEDATSERRLSRSISKLSDALEHQRIVWLAGVHRPELVVLGPQASGISLVR